MPSMAGYSGIICAARQLGHMAGRIIFPPKCLKCGVYLDPRRSSSSSREIESCFCDTCMEGRAYERIKAPFCSRCGLPFSSTGTGHVCENCLKEPPVLGKVRAAVKYEGIIKEAIPLLKYKSKLSLSRIFEKIMFQAYIRHFHSTGIDLILPVPLHYKKLKSRGFNQSYLLIRNFSNLHERHYGSRPCWSIDISSFKRIRHTNSQTGFDIKKRKINLKNAFKSIKPLKIKKRHILLIDDVFTTGATCNEAAVELLRNGAKQVDALVLARA